MTKPIENTISVRNFGKCFSKDRRKFKTERGVGFEGDLLLVFLPARREYEVWWRGPHAKQEVLKGGRITTYVNRKMRSYLIGRIRSRNAATAALNEYFFSYGAKPSE